MTVRIVEVLGSPDDVGGVARYLVGLSDLGWVDELYVRDTDGSVIHLVHGRDPEEFDCLEHALEGVTVEGAEITTVAIVPFADTGAYRSSRRILGAGTDGREAEISSSLLLCPVVTDHDPWWESIPRIDDLGEIWDRRVILSPEDRTRSDEFAQPVGRDDITSHAAAAAAVLSGGVDPAVTVSLLAPANADEYRIVRLFARSADADALTRQIVSTVLDDVDTVYDGERTVVPADRPERLVDEAVQRLVREHRLHRSPPPLAPPRADVGFWGAVRLGLAHVAGGLRQVPPPLTDETVAATASRVRHVLRAVFTGHDDVPRAFARTEPPTASSPEELARAVSALRDLLASRLDDPVIDRWLPDRAPEPEPELWADMFRVGLSLLDGDADHPRVHDPALIAPGPLSEDIHRLLEGEEDDDHHDHLPPLRYLLSDPWRLATILRTRPRPPGGDSDDSAADGSDSDDSAADGSDTDETPPSPHRAHRALESAAQGCERSFGHALGAAIVESVHGAHRSLADRLHRLADSDDEPWDDRPERRARHWLTTTSVLAGAAVVAAAVSLLGPPDGTAAALVAGIPAVVAATAALIGAWRVGRALDERDRRLRHHLDLFDASRSDWLDLTRLTTVYRQYRDWAAILAAEVHDPVGRSEEVIVFGAQQTRPRWLLTARSTAIRPGRIEQIRREIFQSGWRIGLHDELRDTLLAAYAESHGLREPPDPRSDVTDAYRARRHLVEAYLETDRAVLEKRAILERHARSHLDWLPHGIVPDDWIESVEVRYGRSFTSLDTFFELDGRDNLAAYLFDGHDALIRLDRGNPRDVETSIVSSPPSSGRTTAPPAPGGDDAGEQPASRLVPSRREGHWACAVRLDVSHRVGLRQAPAATTRPTGHGGASTREREVSW